MWISLLILLIIGLSILLYKCDTNIWKHGIKHDNNQDETIPKQDASQVERETMSTEEYLKLRKFLEQKTNKLWEHETKDQQEKGKEPKNAYQAGFSPGDIALYDSPSGFRLYLAWTATFGRLVFNHGYDFAFKRHKELFGTGNADDVMSALFMNENEGGWNLFNWDIKRFSEYLREEECCYVVRKEGDSFSDAFLRIDLFRMIKSNTKTTGNNEFVGGLFHVLDHFAINGKNLGTGTDQFNVPSVLMVVLLCVESFANMRIINDEVEGEMDLDDSHCLRLVFYKESESGAYYIKTAFPIRKVKEEIKYGKSVVISEAKITRDIAKGEHKGSVKKQYYYFPLSFFLMGIMAD